MSLHSRFAPFRHDDGTGCWTIGCKKKHGVKSSQALPRKSIPSVAIVGQIASTPSYPVTPANYVMPPDVSPDTQHRRLREIASRVFRDDVTFNAPQWELAANLGFLSIRMDDGSEVLMTSFAWHEEDFSDAGYSVDMTEAYWVRDGVPVAYYSFVMGTEDKPTPPLIYRTEVRADYRGERLASQFKKKLNSMLTTKLHSQGIYTTAGYHAIDRSPVWSGDVAAPVEGTNVEVLDDGTRVYNNADRTVRFVSSWDRLESDAFIDA